MISICTLYLQGIQIIGRNIAYCQAVEIRHCTVEDICQRIFRDRVNFFAVIYFHITVITGLISHINSKRLLYRLCFLFILGILHSDNCIRIVKSILGIVGAVIIYKFIVCQRSDCRCHSSCFCSICLLCSFTIRHIPEQIVCILCKLITILFIYFNICDRSRCYGWKCATLRKIIQSSHKRLY